MPPPINNTKLTLSLLGPAGPTGPAGAAGAAGPNEVTASTATDLTGALVGAAGAVSTLTYGAAATDEVVVRDAGGQFEANGVTFVNSSASTYANAVVSDHDGSSSATPTYTNTLPLADGRLLVDSANLADLLDASGARTNLGLGTTDSPTFAGATLAAGTLTTSQPVSITQTWNAAGVTFTGLKFNAEGSSATNSAAASLLMDLQVGGTTKAKIDKSGVLTVSGTHDVILNGAQNAYSNQMQGGVFFGLQADGTRRYGIGKSQFDNNLFYDSQSHHVFRKSSNATLATIGNGWSFLSNENTWGIGWSDVFILRDAAATLAQRNGTNAQTFRVYGTYTGSTNFERLNIGYNATATAYQIGTEKGSGGGTARPLEFQIDGTTRLTLATTGSLISNVNFTCGNSQIASAYLYNAGAYFYGATNAWEQRNGSNAQTFRVYDTYTSATDYHRMAIATARATATGMSGATVTLTNLIPAGAVVVGVTAKVTTAVTGATGVDIGTAADTDRFGANRPVALGTTTDNRDWTAGTIECFPSATSIILTAVGSNFTGGAMYVSVQYLTGQAD